MKLELPYLSAASLPEGRVIAKEGHFSIKVEERSRKDTTVLSVSSEKSMACIALLFDFIVSNSERNTLAAPRTLRP